MKVAILYSGAIRNLTETIDNNLQILTNPDDQVDLYFSTWDHVGYADNINSPDFLFAKRKIDKDTKITEELVTSIVPTNVNIKKLKIETYDKSLIQFELINGTTDSFNGQFYKIYDCCTLLDTNEKYDMVVRLRCDLMLNQGIDRGFLHNLVCDDKIIFASKIWYDYEYKVGLKSINDMIWITNQKLIAKTCNMYKNADGINRIIKERGQTELNYGESVCFMNLEVENLVDHIYTHDFDYNIMR